MSCGEPIVFTVRDRMGWICPKCNRSNSPDNLTCQCNGYFVSYPPVFDKPCDTNLPGPEFKPFTTC